MASSRNGRALERARIFSLVIPCLGACEEPHDFFPDPLEIQWEGENIRFAADSTLPVCAGSHVFLDRYLGELEAIGGQEAGLVSYFAIPQEEVGEFCRNEVSLGCAVPGKSVASEAVIVHELVHNARYASAGFPSPGTKLFEEGLADLYDPRLARYNLLPAPSGTLQLPSALESFLERVDDDVTAPDRVSASFYLSALADRYGDRPVWDFTTQTGELHEDRPLRDIFEENFPESFDDFNDEFIETGRCSEWAKTRHLLECEEDGPDIDASLETLILRPTENGVMDCGSPDVVGPRMGEMWATRTFDVVEPIEGLSFVGAMSSEDEDEELMLRENDPDGQVYAWLTKCGGGCSNSRFERPLGGYAGTFDLTEPIELEPGRYLVRFVRPYDDPGYAAFSVSSTPDWPF